VFPSHVAKALMEGRKVEPESKACVTIFFSDIVGYTELGGSMEPRLVMNMLDRYIHMYIHIYIYIYIYI
jgi:class 3 adenylate cyclase